MTGALGGDGGSAKNGIPRLACEGDCKCARLVPEVALRDGNRGVHCRRVCIAVEMVRVGTRRGSAGSVVVVRWEAIIVGRTRGVCVAAGCVRVRIYVP